MLCCYWCAEMLAAIAVAFLATHLASSLVDTQGIEQFRMNSFNIVKYISNCGYPVEAHVNIATKDGYLLDMFRIPYGKFNTNNSVGRMPVLLMHGLLGSAENWIILGPSKALAFQLADLGYDVWLGNARGSAHSRKHVRLNPDWDPDYWQFSWHEIGVYDLPAKIDYVLKESNRTQLYYIGHSQGTTSYFVMASERPEYNSRVRLMIALAPIVFMSNMPHPAFKLLSNFEGGLSAVARFIRINEFVPNNQILRLAGQALCQEKAITNEICASILFLICGYDSDQLDRGMVPIIMETMSNSASTKQFIHYAQLIKTGLFQKYDHGYIENLLRYRSSTPPSYNLKYIQSPVALFYANNDWLSSTHDVERLYRSLPNPVMKYLIPYESFNHLDFIFARNVTDLLYSKIFGLLKQL